MEPPTLTNTLRLNAGDHLWVETLGGFVSIRCDANATSDTVVVGADYPRMSSCKQIDSETVSIIIGQATLAPVTTLPEAATPKKANERKHDDRVPE